MPPADKVCVYFREVVQGYSVGDVRSLLSIIEAGSLDKARPLLNSVVNGIDMLVGMMLGFDKGSRQRSVEFMKRHLGFSEEIAGLLYVLVRCGVSHEGTTKLTIQYFVYARHPQPGRFLYLDDDGSLFLNVTELAYLYLGVVCEIGADVKAHLHHVPVPKTEDEKLLAAVDPATLPKLADFLSAAKAASDAAESENPERLGIARSSPSPFLREHLARFKVSPSSPAASATDRT